MKNIKPSPYKRKFVSPRPKSSLEVRVENGSKRNRGRVYSMDMQSRSKTPIENY